MKTMENSILRISENSAPDPFITYYNGKYFGMFTEHNKITVYKSDCYADIFNGEKKTVFEAGKEVFDCIWAPELHHIGNHWYIYSSGQTVKGEYDSIRPFCLESVGNDPFDDYMFKAFTISDFFAIDQTVFYEEKTDKYYLIFSKIFKDEGKEKLLISELENPWTVKDSGNIICETEYDWEKREGNIIEGAFVLKRNGRVFVIYSANDTFSPYYCLGMLEYVGDNPLKKSSYQKSPQAVFEGNEKLIAPGHACVFDNGKEHFLCFHGNTVKDRYDRFAFVKQIEFNEFGNSKF